MEVAINSISDVEQEAEFLLTADELQEHFERAYRRAAPDIDIRGFRRGKAPLDMIKKLYGEDIEHEALNEIANESFFSVMEEKNIRPIGRPSMVGKDFQRGSHFKFKVHYEVKPTFELKPYKGIEVEKPVHHVTDEEVQAEVERLRRVNANLLGVTLVRDNENHVITADVQELADDGMPLIGKKTQDARFELADERLISEIREVLSKAEVGGEYRVRFTSEHDDHAHTYHLAITVKRIEKVELPRFDHEFVKKITGGSIATTEEFLAKLRKDIESYWMGESARLLEHAIMDELVRMHDFAVPESLVNSILDSLVADMKEQATSKQLPRGFDEARFRNENRATAIFQARWILIRERLIEAEQISVTDEDVDQLAAVEAAMFGLDKERLLQHYQTNPPTQRILSAKLMKILKENAHVKERVFYDTEY